jgi:hypothetical protein|nr:MAG TPA: hypothetical protein [Caudoviricetes sp.]
MEILLNKKYFKNLTYEFLENLVKIYGDTSLNDDIHILDLDVIGIQVSDITDYVDRYNLDGYVLSIVFIDQKNGDFQYAMIDFIFEDKKLKAIELCSDGLQNKFQEIIPALEKNLMSQLYIFKLMLEETEE